MSIWRYANPAEFMRLSGRLLGPLWVSSVVLLAVGLGWVLLATPDDYKQGSTVKILFIHVPSAVLAVNVYAIMAIASAVGIVRRHHVSFLVAKAAAPIGAAFTAIALITGAVWGQPMWGTWWVWDARLTSVLIMFFFYLGYMALWATVDEPDKAGDLSGVLCLVGVIFAFLARYSVNFWATLHQGASMNVAGKQEIEGTFFWPLMVMGVGFWLLFAALLLVRARTEIRTRRARSMRMQRMAAA